MQCAACGLRYRGECPHHGGPRPHDPADLPQPDFPGYRVIRALGAGGFGAVYLAEGAEGEVAIKVAHKEHARADARLRREAVALSVIGPPHVPRFHRAGELPDGSCYVVMERVPWYTLGDVLNERQRLSVVDTVAIARGLLRSLAAAHAVSLVHRDLKPENMFVAPDGQSVKLVDFGLVKQLGGSDDGEALTVTGTILGSAAYISPEQAAGRLDIDGRTDLYAVGVILYEALAGRPPFLGNAAEVLHAHLGSHPPRLSTLTQLPEGLEQVIHRCLGKRPDDRPATAGEVLAALESDETRSMPPAARTTDPFAVPAAGREKQLVGMLFFRAAHPATVVQKLMATFAGAVARAEGGFVAVFAGDDPVRRALAAARAVIAEGLATAAVVDAHPATAVPRPDGARRYVSAQFRNESCSPAPGDPPGVQLTPAARDLVDDVSTDPIPGTARTWSWASP